MFSKSPCATLKAIPSSRERRTAPQKIGATVIAKTKRERSFPLTEVE